MVGGPGAGEQAAGLVARRSIYSRGDAHPHFHTAALQDALQHESMHGLAATMRQDVALYLHAMLAFFCLFAHKLERLAAAHEGYA